MINAFGVEHEVSKRVSIGEMADAVSNKTVKLSSTGMHAAPRTRLNRGRIALAAGGGTAAGTIAAGGLAIHNEKKRGLSKSDRRMGTQNASWNGHLPKHTPGAVSAGLAGATKPKIPPAGAAIRGTLKPMKLLKKDANPFGIEKAAPKKPKKGPAMVSPAKSAMRWGAGGAAAGAAGAALGSGGHPISIASGAAVGGAVGALSGHARAHAINNQRKANYAYQAALKKSYGYDPEANRHRRAGVASGAAFTAAAVGGASGGFHAIQAAKGVKTVKTSTGKLGHIRLTSKGAKSAGKAGGLLAGAGAAAVVGHKINQHDKNKGRSYNGWYT